MNTREDLRDKVNRSKGQSDHLFELVGRDFDKLVALEVQIKNCHVAFCPSTKEEVAEVMAMTPKSKWFELPTPPKG